MGTCLIWREMFFGMLNVMSILMVAVISTMGWDILIEFYVRGWRMTGGFNCLI